MAKIVLDDGTEIQLSDTTVANLKRELENRPNKIYHTFQFACCSPKNGTGECKYRIGIFTSALSAWDGRTIVGLDGSNGKPEGSVDTFSKTEVEEIINHLQNMIK